MSNVLILIIVLMICAILWSLPLYITMNLVLWLFHLPTHITLLQAFGIGLLLSVVNHFLFGEKGRDD